MTSLPPRPDHSAPLSFGAFEYDVGTKTLTENSRRVPLGARVHALLHALAVRAGEVVSPSELMAAAWPSTHVDSTNLRVQIAALRRVLVRRGDQDIISNVSGHGYRLNIRQKESFPRQINPSSRPRPSGLAAPVTPIRGRSETVSSVLDKIEANRLVSIVGPGGIGKTRVAIEVSWRLADRLSEVYFVDLAPLTAAEFVASTIATVLDVVDTPATNSVDRIVQAVRDRHVIVVLDNCEHVLDEVARLAARLLADNPRLKLIATSREPLKIEGEVLVRLGGLRVPETNARSLSLSQALAYPAVELLVERAVAAADDLVFDDEHAPYLVAICHKLDCIPLAIELAAPRLASFGAAELLANLDKQLATLGEGRRTSSTRHRTLRATLEWSFGQLSNEEAALVIRLARFRSAFPLGAVAAMSARPEPQAVIDLSGLVDKSLVVVERSDSPTTYRLLETTRSFLEEKLNADPQADDIKLKHAQFVHSIFERGRRGPAVDPVAYGGAGHNRRLIDDVRAAITWALAQQGQSALAVGLIVDSAPIWFRLSILPEYARVLDSAAGLLWKPDEPLSSEARWLVPSLHIAHYNAVGLGDKIAPMLVKALGESELAGDTTCALNCLYPLFGTSLTQARYGDCLAYAERFAALAPQVNDDMQRAMGDRIVALALWRSGRFQEAKSLSEASISGAALTAESPVILQLVYKQSVAARGNFSNLLWLQGKADEALALADDAVEAGLRDDEIGLCYTLAHALIPLSFWTGGLERAESEIGLLLDLAKERELGLWLFWGQTYEALLKVVRGDVASLGFVRDNLHRVDGLHRHILATVVPETARQWLRKEPRFDRSPAHWCSVELQRVSVELRRWEADPRENRSLLLKALDVAELQGALAWKLRTSLTLAENARTEWEVSEARRLVEGAVSAFTEGHSTLDLLRAAEFLDGA